MKLLLWPAGLFGGLLALTCHATTGVVPPSMERGARAQPLSTTAAPARRRAESATHKRRVGTPRSRAARTTQSNAASEATASSHGGVGVGSQGQSLVIDSHARGPASSAIAPPLTSSNDTCMGSASVGAAAMAFGLSLGSTYVDENCMMLKNSRELWNMGYRGAAIARMCMDTRNREALETAGVRCPAPKKQELVQPATFAEVMANDPAYR
jgi:hypothetical protein